MSNITVKQFLLKKFPTSEYMDCPIPKEYWEIMQEYAEYYALQNKISYISEEEYINKKQLQFNPYTNEGIIKKAELIKYLEEYVSIVNERKDNIPADFKQITGHNSPKEYAAYEKGREDEQEVIMKWIEQWNGSSNSVMGALLNKKFDERKDNVGVWVKVSERNPVKFGMYICKVKVIDDGVVYNHVAYNQYNDDKKEWVNPTISNNSCEIIEWLDESQPKQKEVEEYEDEMPPL